MNAIGARVASLLIGLATAIVIVALSILPFLTPQWVAFEQGRANATAWTGFTTEELRVATDAILSDLIVGGDFAVEISGTPVLNEREQSHMVNVRTVFRGLWILAVLAVLALAVLAAASRRNDRSRTWRAVRRGALGLVAGVVIAGVVALVAFDQLFEVFHRIFFPAGSYLFDPATERLVQLFPFQFWEESAMIVGAVIVAAALVVAFSAGRRAAVEPGS